MADVDDAVMPEAAGDDAQPSSDSMTIEQALDAAWEQLAQPDGATPDKPADKPADAAPDKPADAAPDKAEEAAPDKPAEPSEEALKAPEQWDAASKESFAKQPKEVQQWMLDRHAAMEGDYTRKAQDVAPYRETATRWQDYITRTGQRPDALINDLLQVDQVLRHGTDAQAAQVLKNLARDRGYELVRAGEGGSGAGGEGDDPLGEEIRRHQAPMLDEVRQLREQIAAREAEQKRVVADRAHAEVVAFEAEKDAEGNLKHPHFAEVRETMAQLAQTERLSGRPDSSYEQLYEQACWVVPGVRARMVAAQSVQAQAEQARRAEQQRAAGSTVTDGAGTAAQRKQPPKTLDDALQRAWEELSA